MKFLLYVFFLEESNKEVGVQELSLGVEAIETIGAKTMLVDIFQATGSYRKKVTRNLYYRDRSSHICCRIIYDLTFLGRFPPCLSPISYRQQRVEKKNLSYSTRFLVGDLNIIYPSSRTRNTIIRLTNNFRRRDLRRRLDGQKK